MTAQGERYARYVGWIGEDRGSYDGNQIAAGEAITGESGLTTDAALHRICASLLTDPYDPERPLMDYMAAAAEALSVPGGWDSVGNELPVTKPTWPPGPINTWALQGNGVDNGVFTGQLAPLVGKPLLVEFEIYVVTHVGQAQRFVIGATNTSGTPSVTASNWTLHFLAADQFYFQFNNTTGMVFSNTAGAIPTGVWIAVKLIYDGLDIWIELDGVPTPKTAVPTPGQWSAAPPLYLFHADNQRQGNEYQIRGPVRVTEDGVLKINAPLDEGAGLTINNAVGGTGTLSSATLWQTQL